MARMRLKPLFQRVSTFLDMIAVGDVISEVFSATMHTAHRLPDLVTGAQVEDITPLFLVDLETELARQLKHKTRMLV